MTMVPPTGAVVSSGTGTASTNPLNQLDNTQTFLDLLVAQLKNQNPTSPQNPTAFMTEISQLTAVESQTSLASEEQVVAADSMIGMTVTGSSAKGTISGVVSGVLLSPNGAPELQIGSSGAQLALSAVTKVQQAAATTAAGTTGSTSTGSGSTTAG